MNSDSNGLLSVTWVDQSQPRKMKCIAKEQYCFAKGNKDLMKTRRKNTTAVLQRTAVLSFRDAKLVKVLKKDYQRYSRTNRQEESFSYDLFDFLLCIDSWKVGRPSLGRGCLPLYTYSTPRTPTEQITMSFRYKY